jgi:DNA-binding GntR family transcriptional regulator
MSGMTRSDLAYEQIKDWLQNSKTKPGEVISSYKISQALNLSRTPVTAALKKLEHEGFIEIIPQVGCTVRRPNPDEAREDFLIRAVLEGFACEIATTRCTQSDVDHIRKIYEESIAASQEGDSIHYAKCNKEFHQTITDLSGNKRLIEIVRRFWENLTYQFAGNDFVYERNQVSIQEHGSVLDAIEKRDAMLARRLLESHLRCCTEEFCAAIAVDNVHNSVKI